MLFNRTIVTLTLILFALSGASAQTLIPVDSLAVFDATGKRMGTVQSQDNEEVVVFFQLDGLRLFFAVRPSSISGSNNVAFESADCSGQPLIRNSDDLFPGTAVSNSTGTVFVADRSAPSQTLVLGSELDRFSDFSCRSPFSSNEETYLPALEFPNLLAQFTPPFSVQIDAQASGQTVLVANFLNGNNAVLSSRVYLFNGSDQAGDVTARVFTLPVSGSTRQELTTTPLALGSLGAKEAFNIKLDVDILAPLGIGLPYTGDGGNLTVEFTVGAGNVSGVAQVFSSELAFGTYPMAIIQ